MKVRLIIKETYQPPIDTPASIQWQTIEIENEDLFKLMNNNKARYGDREFKHSTFQVVGAEPMEARREQTT